MFHFNKKESKRIKQQNSNGTQPKNDNCTNEITISYWNAYIFTISMQRNKIPKLKSAEGVQQNQ